MMVFQGRIITYTFWHAHFLKQESQTITATQYSAPEQESQLLKIFIESFLSSKRV